MQIKRALVAGLLAVAILVAPAGVSGGTVHAAPISTNPTGNSRLDDLCRRAADLINQANTEGDLALIHGDDAGAQAWYDLADEMLSRSKGWGCNFSARLADGALPERRGGGAMTAR